MSMTYRSEQTSLSSSGKNAKRESTRVTKDDSNAASPALTSTRSLSTSVSNNAKVGDNSVKLPTKPANTAIAKCVQQELRRYFDLLDGEDPTNVYHLVMRQAEHALIESVMQECGGNQSKATKWLGISRGNLRNKLADMGYD